MGSIILWERKISQISICLTKSQWKRSHKACGQIFHRKKVIDKEREKKEQKYAYITIVIQLSLFFKRVHPQIKVLTGQEFSGMGCLKIFWVNGQRSWNCINIILNDGRQTKKRLVNVKEWVSKTKVLTGQEFSGFQKIFWVKGKKSQQGRRTVPPLGLINKF